MPKSIWIWASIFPLQALTFKNAHKLQQVAAYVPMDHCALRNG